jgi:hypothetical protein
MQNLADLNKYYEAQIADLRAERDAVRADYRDLVALLAEKPSGATEQEYGDPELPEKIMEAIRKRATEGSMTWGSLIEYGLEQLRVGQSETDIAESILIGGKA